MDGTWPIGTFLGTWALSVDPTYIHFRPGLELEPGIWEPRAGDKDGLPCPYELCTLGGRGVQPAMARRSPIRMNIAGRREPVSRDSKDEVPSVQTADL